MSENSITKNKCDSIDVIVGERLKKRRLLLKISQQDLGQAIHVSPQQIRKYECGTNRMTSGKLYELAEALQVSIEYFFDDKNYAQKAEEGKITPRLIENQIEEGELSELVRYFNTMRDITVRKKVLDLIKSLGLVKPA